MQNFRFKARVVVSSHYRIEKTRWRRVDINSLIYCCIGHQVDAVSFLHNCFDNMSVQRRPGRIIDAIALRVIANEILFHYGIQ